jgi:hypothetical protein
MAAESVDDFVAGLAPWQQEIAAQLRELIRQAAPELREGIKWSQPVYELQRPVCYIQSHQENLNLGFWRGIELSDPEGMLEGTGKRMRHVKLRAGDKFPSAALTALVKQAVELEPS